jgi:hypothetical protein
MSGVRGQARDTGSDYVTAYVPAYHMNLFYKFVY